jgi:hypothetical protein
MRNMKKSIVYLVMTVSALGLLARGAEAAGKSCTALVVSSDGNPGHGKASFSVSSDPVLHFHLVVPGNAQIDKQDSVNIQIGTPNGYLYQSIDLAVAPSGSKETTRQVHGYLFPLNVQTFAAASGNGNGALHVSGTIPVAGSTIESFSLYGKWSAQASLGNGNPCSTSFTMKP